MKYQELPQPIENEVEKAIKENNIRELARLVVSVAMYSDNYDYAENLCLRLANHKNENIRGNAILGLGYIAMFHQKLNIDKAKPLIENALSDESEYVRGHANCAKDDSRHIIDWKNNK